ncbi:hypothetical protein U1Q18_026727 [Sarracenia purpurea var. burkii]
MAVVTGYNVDRIIVLNRAATLWKLPSPRSSSGYAQSNASSRGSDTSGAGPTGNESRIRRQVRPSGPMVVVVMAQHERVNSTHVRKSENRVFTASIGVVEGGA